jgi:hypothetical protein
VRRRGPDQRTAHIGFRRATPADVAGVTPERDTGRRRTWNEILSSASVILAGVLVVVGFGFVASRAMRSDSAPPLPAPPPTAALGGADLPTASPGLIPLETPTPTSAPPSPSPSATSAVPTKAKTKAPVDQGAVAIATGTIPGTVNLTAEGTRDWVHWGEDGTFSLERNKNGGFAILEGTPTAPRFRHALSPQRFSWTGGDPVDHSDGTPTGIRTCGAGNAFTISAPAGTGTRVLRVYVGVLAARGRLEASLSAGSATAATTIEQRDGTFRSVVYTVTYRAPKSARINLKWVTQQAFGNGCGGVALEAATLH